MAAFEKRKPQSCDSPLPQRVFKFVVIGEVNAGKTSFVNRFGYDQFNRPPSQSVYVDIVKKTLQLPKGDVIQVDVWDTAGQERYRSLTSSYYRGAKGVFVVYDVTDPNSYSHIQKWLTELDLHAKGMDIVVFVVGTKQDLANGNRLLAKGCANKKVNRYVEVSSKTGEGVYEAFVAMTELVLDSSRISMDNTNNDAISLTNGNQNPRSRCCF